MAYDAQFNDAFDGKSNHRIEIYVRRDAVSGNSSRYWWQLAARRTSGAVSWNYDNQPYSVYNGAGTVTGSHDLAFSSSVSVLIIASGYSPYIAHDSNGYLSIWVDGKMSAPSFGSAYAGGTLVTDRIAKVPSKPAKPVLLSIGMTEVQFQISAPNNGGSAILDYQLQIGTSPNWPGNGAGLLQTWTSGASIQNRGGLPVGRDLYIRYRPRNAVGYGPFSDGLAVRTKSGVQVGIGGSFIGSEVMIGAANAFSLGDVYLPSNYMGAFQLISEILGPPLLVDVDTDSATAGRAFIESIDERASHVLIERSTTPDFSSGVVSNVYVANTDNMYPTTWPAAPKIYIRAAQVNPGDWTSFWSDDIITLTF